jgi:hypothetical protein
MCTGDERRKGNRVEFVRGVNAQMIGIDGTWRRDCLLKDVSETGVRLAMAGSNEGLNIKQFF